MIRFAGEVFFLLLVGVTLGQTQWGRTIGQPLMEGAKKVFKWAKEATTGDATAK
jgi:hypothetical protein